MKRVLTALILVGLISCGRTDAQVAGTITNDGPHPDYIDKTGNKCRWLGGTNGVGAYGCELLAITTNGDVGYTERFADSYTRIDPEIKKQLDRIEAKLDKMSSRIDDIFIDVVPMRIDIQRLKEAPDLVAPGDWFVDAKGDIQRKIECVSNPIRSEVICRKVPNPNADAAQKGTK